ncbi:MAG: hypothetical protein ACLVJ6_05720 [Merdibacter sp.]
MIEFLVLCCVYKLLYSDAAPHPVLLVHHHPQSVCSVSDRLSDGVALFVAAIPVMFLTTRHWRSFAVSMTLIGGGCWRCWRILVCCRAAGSDLSSCEAASVDGDPATGTTFSSAADQCYQLFYPLYHGRRPGTRTTPT